jgi:hypothetical protein|tara:strand:+ start:149 stop:445 length:297 start_codon:yes stop_codon:yes gene_type:complete
MRYILIGILATLLQGCAYNPIVDHRGLDGKNVAFRYNDDLETCRAIALKNSNFLDKTHVAVFNYYIRPSLLWLPDKKKDLEKTLIKTCLTNRGHSVLN